MDGIDATNPTAHRSGHHRGGQRVTLRDVAREAGVSLKTASNVINHSGRMSGATRERVQAVIERLGYRVNVSARNLSRNSTGAIMLAVPTLTAPYLAELANRTIDMARTHGYATYVTTYTEGTDQGARHLLERFNTTMADGLILSLGEVDDLSPDDLDVDFPLVVVGARRTWGKADHITPDDVHAAARAAAYLYDRGSTHLAVVGTRGDYDEAALLGAAEGNAQLRLRGIIEESHRRGLAVDPRLLAPVHLDWTIGAGSRAMQPIIDSGVPFDGVIGLNDQLAIGAFVALRTAGIAVPEQVQVIGFDDSPDGEFLQVPLTTMAPRLDWITETAVERLVAHIKGAGAGAEARASDAASANSAEAGTGAVTGTGAVSSIDAGMDAHAAESSMTTGGAAAQNALPESATLAPRLFTCESYVIPRSTTRA